MVKTKPTTKGQVTIPKDVRERLRLFEQAALEHEVGDGGNDRGGAGHAVIAALGGGPRVVL